MDAAVATGFALAVVYPDAGNLGGGGFMMLRMANGESHFLDFREEAPLARPPTCISTADGKIIPEASTVGYLAVGVPGTVAGLVEAQRRFGKLPLRQVMAPAIQFAEQGYVLSAEEAAMLHDPVLSRFPESRRIFQRNGNFYQAGEVFRQPELARTLTQIEQDPEEFLSWRPGQRTCPSHPEAWRAGHQERPGSLPGKRSQASYRQLSPVRDSGPASTLLRAALRCWRC